MISQIRPGLAALIAAACLLATSVQAQRQMESLGRGVVAVRTGTTSVYVGWRMLGTDPEDIAFNLYRSANGGGPVQLTTNQTQTTDFIDPGANTSATNSYFVRPVIGGVEQSPSAAFTLPANAPTQQYLSIPLTQPPGGVDSTGVAYTYWANDASAADLDGDGEYEIILKWNPTDEKPAGVVGTTGNIYLDAYKLDGTRLWRIDLGPNIRAGAQFEQFVAYDLDGDGKAEVAAKTAPGTVDGLGNNVIMPGDDPGIVYTNADGYILTGPEYLTLFNGQTGAAMVTTNYVAARGDICDWGDCYGHRGNCLNATVAFLDGQRPSLVMQRGIYTRVVLAAWDWRNGQLTQRWVFDSTNSGYSGYAGQGNHGLSVGDADGDGKDEIVIGAAAIDHDGTGLYTTGWGHGDAMHFSDMDPDRPGLEVWDVHEPPQTTCGGGEFRDGKTAALIFGLPSTGDTGRGCAANLLPSVKGYQMWSSSSGGLYNCKGKNIGRTPGSCNFLVWWDADVSRELLDGNHVDKYGATDDTRLFTMTDCSANNGTKNTPCLSADLFGDWREEVVLRKSDSSELRIYTTTIPATNRIYTLMHDPQYRAAIAWQNSFYNQPPHPGFYLGADMASLPVPPISTANRLWKGDGVSNAWNVNTTTNWLVGGVWTNKTAAVFNQGDSVLFDLSGSNNLPVSLAGTLTPGAVTVHSPIDYVFSGTGSLTGTMGLVKAGIGALTINTTNSYTGATTVSDGSLWVNGSLNQSPVTVRGSLWGLGRIGGTGRLGQGLAMQTGASLIPGNGTNAAGTFTITNGLTEPGGVVNYFDLSDDPTGVTRTNDLIKINGNLSLSGINRIQVNLLNSSLPLNTAYPLFQYSGTLNGGISNFTVNVASSAFTLALTNPPGSIALLVISNRAPASITWAGDDVANTWDTGLTANWLNGGMADRFFPNDNVTFNDSGSTNPAVTLTGPLAPASVVVTGVVNYTFAGSGYLTNLATLTKSGSGKLTLNTANASTNKLTILAGILQLGDGSALNGSWSGNISNNASLIVANPGSVTLPGNITGTGSITKDGAGTLILTGTNTCSGMTTISNGTLQIGEGATSGTLGTNIVVNNGALVFNRSNASTNNSAISGTGSLTKLGSGTLVLGGSNTYSGGTTVSGGSLRLTHNNAAGTGPVRVTGSLQLGNGLIATNTFISDNSTTDQMLDCPSGTAIWTGNIQFSGNTQFRPGTTGGTLVLSNSVAAMGTRYFMVPRGTVIFAGTNLITASGGIGFGRSAGGSATVTIKDNASISLGSCALGCGQAMGPISLTLRDSARLTLTGSSGANTFDLLSISSTASSGTLALNGGTLTVGSFVKTSINANQTASLLFNGGVLKATASPNVFLAALTGLSAKVQAGGAKIDDGGFAITISQPLIHDSALGSTNDGGLTKLGAGTLTLASSNGYTGGTTVSNGTLLVNNTVGSGTGTGAVTVVSGATLAGSGSMGGPVTIAGSGTLSPGNGVGTLTVSNHLALNSGTILQYQLGTASDRTMVSSNLTMGGILNISDAGGFGPGTYTLFTYGGGLSGPLPTVGSKPDGYRCTVNTNTPGEIRLAVQVQMQPVFSDVALINGNLVLSGNGGLVSSNYYVLASTNLARPLVQWTSLATNQFTTGGNFSFTNAIEANMPQRFYQIKVP
jgi:autotransporter-associated beta strand protein